MPPPDSHCTTPPLPYTTLLRRRVAAPLGHRIGVGARWGRGRFAALRLWESPFEGAGSRTPCAARAARCRGEGRWKVVGLDRVGTADCASVDGLLRGTGHAT